MTDDIYGSIAKSSTQGDTNSERDRIPKALSVMNDYSDQLRLSDFSEGDSFAASDDGDNDYVPSSDSNSSNNSIFPDNCGKRSARNCKHKKIRRQLNEQTERNYD